MTRLVFAWVLWIGGAVAYANDLSVIDTGAVPDGKTDCTTAFQKALDQAGKQGGGVVNVPAGHFRINGTLKIPGAVTLQGTFRTPPTDQHEARPKLDGSVLLAYAGRGSREGAPFILLDGSMATVAGLMITYPEWKQSDVPPVPYPPTIAALTGIANNSVIDCCLLNSYEGLRFVNAARFTIRNVHGYPSFRGLYVDACYDIGRIENVHFWPFGVRYNQDEPYCKWVNINGVAFEFARTDWQYVTNTFCFGYGVGYLFSKSKAGSCNGNFLGIGADSCRRAVLVEDAQPPGLLITNGEFVGRWGSDDSVTVEIAPTVHGSKVSLNNCSFWGPIDRCVWSRSRTTQFTANACHFLHWDVTGKGLPAIQLDAGKAIIQGNTFGEGRTHVLVGPKVRSAIIMGNQADSEFTVENQAGPRTQLVANEQCVLTLSPEARSYYRIDIGEPGDEPCVRQVYRPEVWAFSGIADKTIRWSMGNSELKLPVLPGKPYTLRLTLQVPTEAADAGNGVYLGDTRIAELPKAGATGTVVAKIPASDKDEVVVSLRVKRWSPQQRTPGSADFRQLGAMLLNLTMQAEGATATQPVNANGD